VQQLFWYLFERRMAVSFNPGIHKLTALKGRKSIFEKDFCLDFRQSILP